MQRTSPALSLGICAATVGLLTVWGGANPVSSLLAVAFLYVAAYLPARQLMFAGEPVGWLRACVLVVLGWAWVAILGRLSAGLGQNPLWGALPSALFGLWTLLRQRNLLLPESPKLSMAELPALVAVGLAIGYSLITGLWMGRGAYPPVLYNVDNAFFLGHIQALSQFDQFPPPEIAMFGTRMGYHYGVQVMAAMLVRSSGLLAHQATFLLLMPLLQLAWVGAAREACRKLCPGLPVGWTLPLALFITPLPSTTPWALHALIREQRMGPCLRVLTNPDSFIGCLPMLNTVYSRIIVLWCLAFLMHPLSRSQFWLLAVSIGSLALFKTTAFIGFGLTLACIAALRVGLDRSKSEASLALAAAAVGFLLILAPDRLPMGASAKIVPLMYVKESVRRVVYLGPVLAIIALALWRNGRSNRGRITWGLVLGVLAILGLCSSLVVLYHFVPGQPPQPSEMNTFQIGAIAHLCTICALLTALHLAQPTSASIGNKMVSCLLLAMLSASLSNAAFNLFRLIRHPELGDGYVNNREAGEILAPVPVTDSLIVTNDFRYPADGGVRDLLQLQLPALFGHHFFGAVFGYGQAGHPQAQERLELQQQFRQSQWPDSAEAEALKWGWTHLLIHRPSPHPSEIPLPLMAENPSYQLYRFQRKEPSQNER